MTFLYDVLGLFRRDIYLQGWWHGGVNEAADDGGDLVLDGGFITVRVTKVLRSKD